MVHQHEVQSDGKMKSKANIAFIVFFLIGGFFLIAEHRAHLSGWFSSYGIWLLLLACPLMHVFMHSGHDHGGHGPNETSSGPTEEKK